MDEGWCKMQSTDLNYTLKDAEFKDCHPLETVNRIKEILHLHGIRTEENWFTSGIEHCYSVRVNVVGTTFGVNGKGLTEEFALASGYGELMERLQLGNIGSKEVQKDGVYSVNDAQDVRIDARAMLTENRPWYEGMSKQLYYFTGREESADQIIMQHADESGKLVATPYFSVTQGKKVYFPSALRKRVYTTNGSAAGNTMEEAVVQAISEIVERNHQLRIARSCICVPDVPENILKRYATAYDVIRSVRNAGYKVVIKDCSLGTKFPVICAIFVGPNGKYHTHYGAYPILEIALERALTEVLQGRNIKTVEEFADFSYEELALQSISHLAKELVTGATEKNPRFFLGEPQYDFCEDMGFSGANNRELFRECVDFIQKQGYDVLVRECSCLGFPTYQVLVPGYSEAFSYRISQKLDDNRFFGYALKTLRNPRMASLDDMFGLLRHISLTGKYGAGISNVHGFAAGAKLSVKLSSKENNFLMAATLAYIYYEIGNNAEVLKQIQAMINNNENASVSYLICLKRYFSLLQNGYQEEKIKELLSYFHSKEDVVQLYTALKEKRNPMERYVLQCDKNCSEACKLYGKCCQKNSDQLTALIGEKTKLLDFSSFEERIRKLMQ